MSEAELAETWLDISRKVAVRKGEPIGFNAETKQVILADKDKQAQPARGMVIGIRTSAKKKKDGNEYGEWITKLNWFCIAPIGTGENSWDKIKERRAKIEAQGADDEDDDKPSAPAGAPQMPVGAGAAPPAGMQVSPTPPQAAVAPTPPSPTPPTPPAAASPPPAPPWVPPPGWVKYEDPQYFGATPESRWYHNNGVVKNELQLRSGQ